MKELIEHSRKRVRKISIKAREKAKYKMRRFKTRAEVTMKEFWTTGND